MGARLYKGPVILSYLLCKEHPGRVQGCQAMFRTWIVVQQLYVGIQGSERLTPNPEDVSSKSSAWTRTWDSYNREDLWGTFFHISDPDVIMSYLTCSTLSFWLRLHNAHSLTLAVSLARCHGIGYFFIHKCSTKAVLKGAM